MAATELRKLGAEAKQVARELNLEYEGKKLHEIKGHNSAMDAFRHAYVSAKIAYEHGTFVAWGLGELNEIKGWWNAVSQNMPVPFNEITMDRYNNGVGREVGSILEGTKTDADIGLAVFEKLTNGDLITSPSNPNSLSYDYSPPTLYGTGLSFTLSQTLAEEMDGFGVPLSSLHAGANSFIDIGTNFSGGLNYNPSLSSQSLYNDGNIERTGWVGADDGILVHDRNGNGKIDDITETLSEYYGAAKGTGAVYEDGFAALETCG